MQSEKKYIESLFLYAWKKSTESIRNNNIKDVILFELGGEWPATTIRKYNLKKNGIINGVTKDNFVNNIYHSLKKYSNKVSSNSRKSITNLESLIHRYNKKSNCIQLYFFTDGWYFNFYNYDGGMQKFQKNFCHNNLHSLKIFIPSSSKNVKSSAFYEVISSANKDDIVIDNTFYAFYVTCSDIVAMKPEEEEKKQDDFVTLKHFNDRVYRNNSTDNIIKSTPFDIKIISTIKTRHVTSKHIDQKKQSLYLLYKKFPDPRILPVFMLNKTTLHKSDIFRSNNLSYNNVESSNCTIDILFLIDLSSKTKSYIGDYLHSILIILSKAVISKKKIQVSVVSFSPTKKQSLLFAFAKHNTLLSISEKLNYLVNDDNDDSNPNMKDTLAFLFSFFNSQTSQYNVRQSAKKKVVILTQGYFNDEHYNNNILEEVEKLKNNHVEIFSVSIKNKKKNIWPPKVNTLSIITSHKKNLGIFMSYPDRIFIRKIIPTSCIFEMSA